MRPCSFLLHLRRVVAMAAGCAVCRMMLLVYKTSLPKVIWEQTASRRCRTRKPWKFHWLQWHAPNSPPKSTPVRGPIPKPQYLPHPWTRPTYDAKRHPDPIRRFSTMHWTDRPTDRPRESLITIGRCAPRATRPNNTMHLLVEFYISFRTTCTVNDLLLLSFENF